MTYYAQRTKMALLQFADNAGPDQLHICIADQGLHCPHTESMDTVVYVEEERMSRSDCTDVHAHLDLPCLYMA